MRLLPMGIIQYMNILKQNELIMSKSFPNNFLGKVSFMDF